MQSFIFRCSQATTTLYTTWPSVLLLSTFAQRAPKAIKLCARVTSQRHRFKLFLTVSTLIAIYTKVIERRGLKFEIYADKNTYNELRMFLEKLFWKCGTGFIPIRFAR